MAVASKNHLTLGFFSLKVVFKLCNFSSILISYGHHLAFYVGLIPLSVFVLNSPTGPQKTLRDIWFAKLARMWIRGPLLKFAKQIVKAPSLCGGCVIAICHTPWSLLLAHWCFDNRVALVVTPSKKWRKRTGNLNVSGGFHSIRKAVQHLQTNGWVCIHADSLKSRGFTSPFLGLERPISMLPARLAGLAGVPLVGVVPTFEHGYLNLKMGEIFMVGKTHHDQKVITHKLIAFFENEIAQNPVVLRGILRTKKINNGSELTSFLDK